MINRRDFTKLASFGAGAALIPHGALSQENSAPSLPPSLAKLQSRKGEAKPITLEERRQRMERARQLMRDNHLNAIVMAGGTSLLYFTNIHWGNSERLFAAVLPAKGEPFYVCPAFENGRAREQIANGPGGNNPDVRTWEEDVDPYQ